MKPPGSRLSQRVRSQRQRHRVYHAAPKPLSAFSSPQLRSSAAAGAVRQAGDPLHEPLLVVLHAVVQPALQQSHQRGGIQRRDGLHILLRHRQIPAVRRTSDSTAPKTT